MNNPLIQAIKKTVDDIDGKDALKDIKKKSDNEEVIKYIESKIEKLKEEGGGNN